MAKDNAVEDYRHDATRKNNPPAGLAAIYERPELLLRVRYINLHRGGVQKCIIR